MCSNDSVSQTADALGVYIFHRNRLVPTDRSCVCPSCQIPLTIQSVCLMFMCAE